MIDGPIAHAPASAPARPPDCNAALVLDDSSVWWGRGIGAHGTALGEVCFNTAMTGYQEIMTDPSYRGQLVCMTYPLIGNYGINPEDVESRRPWVNGFIVKEACSYPSSWRGRIPIETYQTSLEEVLQKRLRYRTEPV